jgi:methionyl-tRNA synthetase
MLRQLGVKGPSEEDQYVPVHIPDTWEVDALKPGHAIGTPELLFTNIPAAKIDEWRDAFGGEELRRQKEIEAEKTAAKKAAKEKEKEKKKLKKAAAAAAAAAQGGPVAEGATTTLPIHPAPAAQVADATANSTKQTQPPAKA